MGKNTNIDRVTLSIIIVNYNSGMLLSETIESIVHEIVDIYYEIIIVDNNSSDNSLDFSVPDVSFSIFRLNENVGFSKANNYGANKAKGDYFYFLNPDAFLKDQNTSTLLSDFTTETNLGISAPEVLNSDCTLQYSARKFPSFRRLFFYTFGVSKVVRTKFTCDYKMEFHDNTRALYPDWVSGAAFIISRNVFNKVQGFDENFFLFYEDIDLCKRVRDLGFEIKYNPACQVTHIWGGSSINLKEFTQKEDFKSRFKYFKKHTSSQYLVSIKLLTFINIVLRFLFFCVKGKFNVSIIYLRTLSIFLNEKQSYSN